MSIPYQVKATITDVVQTANGNINNYALQYFDGLRVSDQSTLLDGCILPGCWWYSVGNTANHNGGTPGPYPYSSSLSELFVCVPGIKLIIFIILQFQLDFVSFFLLNLNPE